MEKGEGRRIYPKLDRKKRKKKWFWWDGGWEVEDEEEPEGCKINKKKRNTLTAPEKLRQSKDTFEKNILLYKTKNKMYVKKPQSKVCGAGWLARIPRVGLREGWTLQRR